MLKHYVEFFSPEPFFLSEIQEISGRPITPSAIPKNAYALRYFDQGSETIDANHTSYLIGDRINYSPMIYVGTAYTLEELKERFPFLPRLILKMEGRNCDRVVLSQCDTWHFLKKDDIVLTF